MDGDDEDDPFISIIDDCLCSDSQESILNRTLFVREHEFPSLPTPQSPPSTAADAGVIFCTGPHTQDPTDIGDNADSVGVVVDCQEKVREVPVRGLKRCKAKERDVSRDLWLNETPRKKNKNKRRRVTDYESRELCVGSAEVSGVVDGSGGSPLRVIPLNSIPCENVIGVEEMVLETEGKSKGDGFCEVGGVVNVEISEDDMERCVVGDDCEELSPFGRIEKGREDENSIERGLCNGKAATSFNGVIDTLFAALKVLAEQMPRSQDKVDIFETAKRHGMMFPVPRWWDNEIEDEGV